MKYAVLILACVAAASAQFGNGAYNRNPYSPFGNQYNRNQNQYNRNQNQYRYQTTPSPYRTYAPLAFTASTPAPLPTPTRAPSPLIPVPVPRYQGDAYNAQILKYGNEINPDGSYAYFYETDNGIAAQAQGTPRDFGGNPPVVPVVSQGSFSWTSPEGQPIAITYVADENGYHPSGDAIPTPPPVPDQIARALAYVAKYSPQKK